MNMGFLFKTGDLLGCPMDATVTCQIHVPKCSGPRPFSTQETHLSGFDLLPKTDPYRNLPIPKGFPTRMIYKFHGRFSTSML